MPNQYTENKIEKVCPICGESFIALPSQQSCSRSCGSRLSVQTISSIYDPSVSSGTVGAIHEMMVATDLMKRGFHVFRALSQSCPCDLVAYNVSGVPYRIEVRTWNKTVTGDIYASQLSKPKDKGRQDCFAFVSRDGEIRYVPDITSNQGIPL